MKDVNDMSVMEFNKLPGRRRFDETIICDSLIILPLKELHDSGYRLMDFIAVKDNKPICRLSGCSDAIHIEGIGGYGHLWFQDHDGIPKCIPPAGWQMDCLAKSGLLRIFCSGLHKRIVCGPALSSFEIYSTPRIDEVNG